MRLISAAAVAAAAAAAAASPGARLTAALRVGRYVPLLSRLNPVPRLDAEQVSLVNKAVAPDMTLEQRVEAVDDFLANVAKPVYSATDDFLRQRPTWTMHETLTASIFISRVQELGAAVSGNVSPYRVSQTVHTYRRQENPCRFAVPDANLTPVDAPFTPHAYLATMVPHAAEATWGIEFTPPRIPFSMDALMGRLLHTRDAQQLLPVRLREEAFLSNEHLQIALLDMLSILNRRIILCVGDIDALMAVDGDEQRVALRFLRECSQHPNVTVLASYRCPEKDYWALTAPDCFSAMYDADVRKRYPSCVGFTGSPIVNPLYGRASFFNHL